MRMVVPALYSAVAWLGVLPAVCAGDGVHARLSSADYSARVQLSDVTVAASLVRADDVRRLFGVDLKSAGYVVVEAALFPDNGAAVEVAAADFMLENMRPASAQAVASAVARKENPRSRLPGGAQVYTTETIGFETGGRNASNGGGRGGVYTSTAVGVGLGNPPYPPSSRDPLGLERELFDKGLPERRTDQPVAGYLYFLKPAGKSSTYELTWFAPSGAVRLRLPTK